MKLQFTKMHGAGNDFVVLDGIHQQIDLTPAQWRALASRHFGVGADQMLVVEKPSRSDVDFRYRIFNADGSEVELDLIEEAGTYRVVEMQRDIAWADAPAPVRAAAGAAADVFTPARVIESTQEDGTVVYELFAPGKPDEPAAEVNWKDGKATLRTERNEY